MYFYYNKKTQKGRLNKLEFKSNNIKFGEFGLKTKNAGIITLKQIEAARKAIIRKLKNKGKLWICTFPSLAITSKPIEARMGKGKGFISYWALKVSVSDIIIFFSINTER